MLGCEPTTYWGEEIGVLPAGHKKRAVERPCRWLCFV